MHQTTKARHRAAALPPDERRAAIIASTIPLLVAHGTAVTTHQIAQAAGIAEGTIFRVFPDKESLIAAAIEQAFCPAPVEIELRAIDAALPLEARLSAAVEILQRRFAYIGQLMIAVGMTKVPWGEEGRSKRAGTSSLRALAEVIEPDRAQLRRDPMAAAHLLRGLAFAGSHPALIDDKPLSSGEIVSMFLDGVRAGSVVSC